MKWIIVVFFGYDMSFVYVLKYEFFMVFFILVWKFMIMFINLNNYRYINNVIERCGESDKVWEFYVGIVGRGKEYYY